MEVGVGSQRSEDEYRKNECFSMKDRVEEKGKWPCGVRKKGVGNNSILCHSCKKWIQKQCGVKGSRLTAEAVRLIG